jgi:hypothetical protein
MTKQSPHITDALEQFKVDTGLSDYAIGFKAVHNGRLMERLRRGRPILNATEARLREFIRTYRPDASTPLAVPDCGLPNEV